MLSTNDEEIGNGDENTVDNYLQSEQNSKHLDPVFCCSSTDCFDRSSQDDDSRAGHSADCDLNTTSDSRDSRQNLGSDDGSRFRACINFDPPENTSDDIDQNTTAAFLEGLVKADGHGHRLVLLDGNTVYWRGHRSMVSVAGRRRHRVKVLAGHRGGHYPAFARYVGEGMLDAAIAGPTRGRQPSATHVLTAIRELDDGHGVLVLVASELSARINYGIAATKARSLGINVKLLAVGDDVVRCRPTVGGNCSRRRGAAGLVLVCKIAGAMSAGGHNLEEIFSTCQRLSITHMATVNAIVYKNLRSNNTENSQIEVEDDLRNTTRDDHDENCVLLLGTDTNGRNAIRTVWTTDATEMVSAVLKVLSTYGDDVDLRDLHRWRNADVVVMVNNLGGMSDARFMIIVAKVVARLTAVTGARTVHRWYTGRMLSSAGDRDDGFSVTVMDVSVKVKVPQNCTVNEASRNALLLAHLDLPVTTSGWTFSGPGVTDVPGWPDDYARRRPQYDASPLSEDENAEDGNRGDPPSVPEVQDPFMQDVLNHVCDRIVEEENAMNAMDAADDGDCGSNWRRGAAALKEAVAAGRIHSAKPVDMLRDVSRLMETRMAGTSGMLLAVLFRSWWRALRERPDHRRSSNATAWVDSLNQGVLSVKAYGMCQPGDRTMLDVLVPAVRGMSIILFESKNPVHLLNRAVREAKAAIEPPTGKRAAGKSYLPDAGAFGVKIVLEAVLEKYLERSAADNPSD